jgi:hypothetical protein
MISADDIARARLAKLRPTHFVMGFCASLALWKGCQRDMTFTRAIMCNALNHFE